MVVIDFLVYFHLAIKVLSYIQESTNTDLEGIERI
jgi:hypothetical protein